MILQNKSFYISSLSSISTPKFTNVLIQNINRHFASTSTKNLSSSESNPIYYYSNPLLNSINSNHVHTLKKSHANNNTTTSTTNTSFIPNYRFTNLSPRRSQATVSTASNTADKPVNILEKVEQVAKQTIACHPTTSSKADSKIDNDSVDKINSHIPFEIKSKANVSKPEESVLQQYLKNPQQMDIKQLWNPFYQLTKPSLTFLIMLSSISSYALAPGSTDIISFSCLTIGILLTSGAANAINMGREPNFDSQMTRTSARPVVRGLVTPNEAFGYAALSGSLGSAILYLGVNPIVANLGVLNIILYSWIYTSIKRKSILNTWVGAVVGAIPPLMGWAACSSLADPGAWCLAALLYAWQFPHFNTLSHNIKDEYKKAGYVMTAFENPKLNARVALRYSLLMFPICFGLSYFGVTDPYFVIDSSIFNGWLTYVTFLFWNQQRKNYSKQTIANGGPSKEDIVKANAFAKRGFWGSVWQLPLVLVFAMLHKKGQWDRLLGYATDEESTLGA